MFKLSDLVSGLFVGTAISISLSSLAMAQTDLVNGTWKLSIPAANQSPTIDLTQSGNTLKGTFHGSRGNFPLTGTVSNDHHMHFTIHGKGGTAEFEGTVDGNTIQGTAKLPRIGKTDWTASR